MSRQGFGRWGAALSGRDFSRALAFAGLTAAPEVGAGRWALHWSWARALDARASDPQACAARWERLADANPDTRVALEVEVRQGTSTDPGWLIETLRDADRVTSVSFLPRATRPHVRSWDWPLDVGFLSDPRSRALREAARPEAWSEFVRLVDASAAVAQVDLLLFPGSLVQALTAVTQQRLPEVHTVVALGGLGATRDPLALLATLVAEADATAGAVVSVSAPQVRQWLERVLFAASHDRSIDEALFQSTPGAPILLGPQGAFGQARASNALRTNLRRAARAKPRAEAASAAPPDLLGRAGVAPTAPLEEAAPALEAAVDRLDWGQEHHAAAAAGEVARAARAAPERDGRFVQARLFRDEVRVVSGPLPPATDHRLDVRIGRPSPEWTQAPQLLPEWMLPASGEGHRLQVVFVAPGLPDPVQTATLWLPAAGDSQVHAFHLRTPQQVGTFDARVTILYRNRVLQTLALHADVGMVQASGPVLTIGLESVLRANLSDLSGSPGFDAALLLNDTDGEHGLTAFSGETAAFIRLGEAEELVKSLRTELEKVTRSPSDYASLETEPSRVLFVTLARAGSAFATSLRELPRMASVLSSLDEGPRRLQVVSVKPDDLIPLELAYDRPFPRATAQICATVKQGLECGAACPLDDATVCPLGFWGIRHVIERRLYDELDAQALQERGADYAIRCEAGPHRAPLATVRTVLFAAAEKAASFDADSFEAAVNAVKTALAATQGKLVVESAWDGWPAKVEQEHPEMLLLLPHTEPELGVMTLEIGSGSRIAAEQIQPPHVATPPPVPPAPGPIVLLLGCRTAAKEKPFSGFISAFRRAHASVVLATMSTVRGRHMAPVAREVVELLVQRAQGTPCSVGELVRLLRLRLLTKGLPVGLTLVGYGEADWQLGGTA